MEEKNHERHEEKAVFEGGQPVHHQLTTASEQQPDVAPKLQPKAVIVTVVVTLYWITLLYTITCLGAYNRNIANILGGTEKQAWIANATQVITIVFSPVFSFLSDSLADRVSRKWFVVIPCAIAAIGSIVGCRANSLNVLIVASTLIGFGAAALGIATAIPSEVLPRRYRPAGQAFVFTVSSLAGIAALLGPASAISNDAVSGWRWIFYSLIICWTVTSILFFVFYSPPLHQTDLSKEHPSLDWIGYTLLAAATTLFLIGITWGGVAHPWKSGATLGTLIGGVALYLVMAGYEWKGRSDGFFHHGLFKNRNFPLVNLSIFIEGFVYLAFINIYPGMVSTVYEHDLFKGNQLSLPFYGAFLVGLPLGGLYASRTKDTVTPTIFGYVLVVGALIGFCFAKRGSRGLIIAMNALAGFGFAQPLTFLTVIAQFSAPPDLIATATAIVLSVRSLGGAVATSVVASVFNSALNERLAPYIAGAVLPLGLNPQLLGPVIGAATGNVQLIDAILHGGIPGITPQILGAATAAAERAFSESWRKAWIITAALGGVGLASVAILKRNRDQLNYIIDAPLQHVHHRHESEEEA